MGAARVSLPLDLGHAPRKQLGQWHPESLRRVQMKRDLR